VSSRLVPDADVAARSGWHFDDAVVGSTLRHPGGRTIGAAEHVWLALVTNNASELHGNADRAATSPYGQPIVLGALTVAIVVGLSEPAEWAPGEAARRRPAGWSSIRLSRVVVPGDTLSAESQFLAAEPLRDAPGGIVKRAIVGRNQRGEEVARLVEDRAVPLRAARPANDGAARS
jgi:itaconyl-CoA hydratase